ncbi:puratrophin-1 [Platichthys flesus]|uniref:puratrophin-1 n=1 Tax=Platichthys flesus TaxID=8260 RepID=UPI002DB7A75F|nr:puratrophin-1 [Platichthys flesus]
MDPDSLRPEPQSEQGEKMQEQQQEEEEEQEESCCEEVVGGRTADRQTEGLSTELSSVHSADSSPTVPHQPALLSQTTGPAVDTVQGLSTLSCPSSQSSFYSVLLGSGALCLPGTRDRSGRALLTASTSSSMWSNPDCERADLLRLLLYYTSTLRKEVRALGVTVLVDARRAAPVPVLFSALMSLQENAPGSIHSVFVLVSRDSSSVRLDRAGVPQVEVLHSLKSLQKHVELQQLPTEFGGSFSFSQRSWLCFRSRVEQLNNQCEDVIKLLQKTINILEKTPLPAAAQDAELLLSRYKAVMCSVLEDSRLVRLQQEGGASLSRLRREESVISVTEDYRAEVETVSSLYDQVDELLHRLVMLSNSRTQQLSFILDFRSLEQAFSEVSSWLQDEGEPRLKNLNEPEDSLELLKKKQTDFKNLNTTAHGYCKRGEALLSRLELLGNMSSADLHIYEVKIHSFWTQLQDFSQRINATEQIIERAVRLFSFLDQAYGWALEGMRHLAGISMEECTLPDKCQAVIGCLEDYQSLHPPIPDSHFQEMKAAAGELRGERGLRQWSFAWSKCQETKKVFDRKMEAAIRTRDSAQRRCSDPAPMRSSTSSRKTPSGLRRVSETSCPIEDVNTSSPSRNASIPLPLTSSPITSTPQHTPLLQRLFRSSSSDVSSVRVDVCSSSPSLPRLDSPSPSSSSSSSSSFSFSGRRQHLRKTQSFDCPSTPEALRYGPCPRTLSEPVRRGNIGVFIRGLEVSSSEAADHTLCPRTPAHSWAGPGHSPGTPGTPGALRTIGSPAADPRPRGSKLRHIVDEMITTEQEYVRSLRYIIHHYFPEMDRGDLPQDLRGKRSVVFGNLEKLLDFHSQFFLRELESCWKHPLRVPHCFLRHQEQFGLYALYSKNKPKSDALLSNHGNSFFRRKQVELGDKMDLSSYLLKPIQRMSKYALLLTDLIKEVGVAQEAELGALQEATKMVKFQLRHGNDLLAMDAIRECDVNLKEQGQLIRQDEFTIWSGRRKCQRHIFLFDELVLFSKPKKMEGGLDVFIYKHSFKTADVGLTESTGDSGLRFEIWFRRRTSKNQKFVLQAATQDVKLAWTGDIARILWTQANKNKEMRLKEMVSMGVGSKPFLDIKPSDAAISDRAVHYIMKSRGARTRASIAVSVFDHSNPFKRGSVTSDPSTSGPSSSGLLGPLNLHMFSQNLPPPHAADGSFTASCIEEDEQEHETSSQPSMTTESSGSSSRCLSGSTGSDSGCVSSHLQEALPEELGLPGRPSSSSSKQHLSSQYISSKAAAVIGPATVV